MLSKETIQDYRKQYLLNNSLEQEANFKNPKADFFNQLVISNT